MPAIMHLVVTIRKEVADRDEGSALFDWVKNHLAERPDLTISGHVTNHFENDPSN